jgi:hypothetical protein
MEGIYIIGEVRPKEEGVYLQTSGGTLTPLKAQGWVHFEGEN